MRSIRTKITLITAAAILIGILSVVFASYFTIQEENDSTSRSFMNLVAENTQSTVESYLDSIEQSVEIMANVAYDTLDSVVLLENNVIGSDAAERTPEQTAAADAYLAGYCSGLQSACASVAGYTHGVITYYFCISPDISETQHGFFYSRVGKAGFIEREPLDARELDPNDIEHTTWYYTTIQRGRPSWIGPYTAHFLNELITYSYIVPIYKAGTLIGVLGMDIPFDSVTEILSDITIFDSGFACLFDSDGKVLYHPQLEFGRESDVLDPAFLNSLFRRESSGDDPVRYTARGEDRMMCFTTLSTGMKLVVTAPVREISASWIRLVRFITIAAVVFIAVFIVILMLVLRLITRPLLELTSASERLADGDYDVELNYKGRDEVGTLTNAFNRMRDHIRSYVEDLSLRARTDDLTGLPNMPWFFELAEAERKRLLEKGGEPAMLFFNLSGLKYFNRQFSYKEGDEVIRGFAELLSNTFGAECVCRIGQDHFAAVCCGSCYEEKLNGLFREMEERTGSQSLSVRVGVYPSWDETVSVNRACDRAKYACDMLRGTFESGWRVFDETMLRQILDTSYIVRNFERAMKEGRISVCYQPIIRAANGCVCDEEALSRWTDPERGAIPPSVFIPILESSRLIWKLDLFVLDEILKRLQMNAREGIPLVPQSLNLSRVDFEACDIVEEVRRRVDEAGIPREKLTIEVTESVIGSDFEFMKGQIERFRSLGFCVWMDDFGSGYSSLDVLQDIHFDLIKFDMRFMQRFDESSESRIILSELIKLAVGLGVDTIAEGVETAAQADFLREVGCTKLQGYYYSRPTPPEEILARYRKGKGIGFENEAEVGYYTAIGHINLYDLASAASDSGEGIGNFFDTLPMAVLESDGESMRIVRCNKSYRDFMTRAFGGLRLGEPLPYAPVRGGSGTRFIEAIERCGEPGAREFVEDLLPDGADLHAMLRHVAADPVTGIYACVAVILGVGAPKT